MLKKRVLIVSNPYFPFVSGVPISSKCMALGLSVRGYAVTLLTEVLQSKSEENSSDEENWQPPPFQIIRSQSLLLAFHTVRQSNVTIMNGGCSRKIAMLSLASRTKLIAWHQMSNKIECVSLLDRLIYSLALWRVNKHVGVSKQALLARNPKRGTVIPNPGRSDVTKYNGVQLSYREREIDFLYVGRLDAIKGVDTLLKALNLLDAQGSRLNLLFVGDGPLLGLVQSSCQSFRSIASECSGNVDGLSLANAYRSAKYIVLPTSSRHREGHPLVLAEAFAFGTPAIVADSPELCEAIEGSGFHFKTDDHASLAEALVRGVNHEKWEEMSSSAKSQFLNNFRESTFLDQVEALL